MTTKQQAVAVCAVMACVRRRICPKCGRRSLTLRLQTDYVCTNCPFELTRSQRQAADAIVDSVAPLEEHLKLFERWQAEQRGEDPRQVSRPCVEPEVHLVEE